MKGNMEERACQLALYIIENKATVRAAARKFNISKSTVHKDLSERLPAFNRTLYLQAKQVLEETRLLLANIHEGPIHFTSNHASNYLSFNDTIPEKTPWMLEKIDSALAGETKIRSEWSRGL